VLSADDNELLTRTGPGTIMGGLMRRYWLPAVLSEELPEPDGPPLRVQVLGERLVAFRDSAGQVGLLHEPCPHRGCSLYLACNEEGGLRCIYHGWKFDVAGRCLDMPGEDESVGFKDKVRAQAYATHEAGGMVWAYMGPGDKTPPFPNFECLGLPDGQWHVCKMLEECNYVQAIEGGIDTVHGGFLHRRTPYRTEDSRVAVSSRKRPRIEVQTTSYGFRYGALREAGEGEQYIRVTPFVMPCYQIAPPNDRLDERSFVENKIWNAWVPRDDEHTWQFQIFYNLTKPIDVQRRIERAGLWLDSEYRMLRNRENNYLQDREAQKTRVFSGVDGIMVQDHAAQESQGPIADRTIEHLAASDTAVIAMRRLMLGAAKSAAEGQNPPGVDPAIRFERVSSHSVVKPSTADWREAVPDEAEPSLVSAS
jgi:phthalate 4,5-dioxygenase oxygenase subunit